MEQVQQLHADALKQELGAQEMTALQARVRFPSYNTHTHTHTHTYLLSPSPFRLLAAHGDDRVQASLPLALLVRA